MSTAHISRRYARALADLGAEAGSLDALVEQLGRFSELYESSTELRGTLADPRNTPMAKKAVLGEIANRLSLSPVAKHVLLLLCDRNRTKLAPEIVQLLREMNDDKRGVMHAEVTTAVALSEGFYTRLREQLEKLTGKKVVLDRKQDPTLIGGVVTRIGDHVFDGSIRARLAGLKNSLLPN